MNHTHEAKRKKRSYDAHNMDRSTHAYSGNIAAAPVAYQWHEMPYTSTSIEPSRFAPTSAPVQYGTSGMMAVSPVDYARHEYSYPTTYAETDSAAVQTANLYRVGPFRYVELANIDGDNASISQESIYSSSTRLHSLTDSERRDSQANSILSSNDMRRESEGYDRTFSMDTINHETCQPEICGPDPPCLDLANFPPIEECTSMPCMSNTARILVPRPQSNPSIHNEQHSPVHPSTSSLSSPTGNSFQDNAITDSSIVQKPKRPTRSKSANATIQDSTAHEKASKIRARQAHSLVERKYRDNLNMKISQLHQTLQGVRFGPGPASRSPAKEMKVDYFDDESLISPELPNEKPSTGSTPTGSKVRKSDVLTEAMSYVNATEIEMRQMSEEITRLNARVKTLEKMVRCEDCTLQKQMITLQVEGQQGML